MENTGIRLVNHYCLSEGRAPTEHLYVLEYDVLVGHDLAFHNLFKEFRRVFGGHLPWTDFDNRNFDETGLKRVKVSVRALLFVPYLDRWRAQFVLPYSQGKVSQQRSA